MGERSEDEAAKARPGLGAERPESNSAEPLAARILAAARECGFDACAIASARSRPDPEPLLAWISRGDHAGMAYMARDPLARCDPERVLKGVRSVVCVARAYGSRMPAPEAPDSGGRWRQRSEEAAEEGVPGGSYARDGHGPAGAVRIARFAQGPDYHIVVRAGLRALLGRIREWLPGVRARIAVDSSLVLERHWAAAAGLGWIGRNGCLVVPGIGSWLVLGELFLDAELPAGSPLPSGCGDCRRCHEACPHGALSEPSRLDARRCIAYWTVEHRGPFPDSRPRIDPWLFGCDLCQEACPWNAPGRASGAIAANRGGAAAPPAARGDAHSDGGSGFPGAFPPDLDSWLAMDRAGCEARVAGTALSRAGFDGLVRNARAIRSDRARGPG